ncbi:MAG: hypothetical protein QN194_14965 [Armatimonadota bacterium]|nr:hypothetical protein [Armatimonadota bacterium]
MREMLVLMVEDATTFDAPRWAPAGAAVLDDARRCRGLFLSYVKLARRGRNAALLVVRADRAGFGIGRAALRRE